jgi:hypothetical protein
MPEHDPYHTEALLCSTFHFRKLGVVVTPVRVQSPGFELLAQ